MGKKQNIPQDVPVNQNIRDLHITLVANGLNIPDLDEFAKDMLNDDLRHELYTSIADEYNLPEYDEFTKDMRDTADLRADGTIKAGGFLGTLQRPDGRVSTELSIGVNIGGKEIEIPTLIPTLTEEEKKYLLSTDPDKIFTGNVELFKQIKQKAIKHAEGRIAQEKSPFAEDDESPDIGIPDKFKPILPDEPKIGRETTAIDIPIVTMEQMRLRAETEEEEKKKSQEEGREIGYAAGEDALLQPLRSFGDFDLDRERGFGLGRDEFVTEQANSKYGYDKAIEEKKKISPKISNEDATVAVINDMARDINKNVWNKKRSSAFQAKNDLKRISNEIAANQKQLELTPGDNTLILRQKQLDEELARKTKVFTGLMGDNYRELFDEEKRTFLDTDWTEQDNQDVEKIYKEHKEWSVSALGEILYEENAKLRYLRDVRHKVIYESEPKITTGTFTSAVTSLREIKNLDPVIKEQYKTVLALGDAFLLNKDFGAVERTAGKAAVRELLGRRYTSDVELSEKFAEGVIKHGGKVTKEQMIAATPTDIEQTAQSFVGTGKAMVELIGATLLLRGAGSAVSITKNINIVKSVLLAKKGKTAVRVFDLMLHMVDGAIRYGLTPSEEITAAMGMGEEAAQFLLSSLFKGAKINKIIRPMVRAMIGGSVETIAEYAGEFSEALFENGWDIDDAVNRAFGETTDERRKRLQTTVTLCFAMSLAGAVGKGVASRVFRDTIDQMPLEDKIVAGEMMKNLSDTDQGIDSEPGVGDVKPFTPKEYMEFETTGRVMQSADAATEVISEIDKKSKELKERPDVPVKLEVRTGQLLRGVLGETPGEITSLEELNRLKTKAQEHLDIAEDVIAGREAKIEKEIVEEEKAYQLGNKGYDTKEELFDDLRRLDATTTNLEGKMPETMHMPTIKAINEFYALEKAVAEKRTGEDEIKKRETQLKDADVTYIGKQEISEQVTEEEALTNNDFDTEGDLTDSGFTKLTNSLVNIINNVANKVGIPIKPLLKHFNINSKGEYFSSVKPLLKVGESINFSEMIETVKRIAIEMNPEQSEKIINTVNNFKEKWLNALEIDDKTFILPPELSAIVNALNEINEKFTKAKEVKPTKEVKAIDLYNVEIAGQETRFSVPAGSDMETIIAKRNETIEKFGGIVIDDPKTTYEKNLEILQADDINERGRARGRNQALRSIAEQMILQEKLTGDDLVNAMKEDLADTQVKEEDIRRQAEKAEMSINTVKIIKDIRRQLDVIRQMEKTTKRKRPADVAEIKKEVKKYIREELVGKDKLEAFKEFLNQEGDRIAMLADEKTPRRDLINFGKLAASATITNAQFVEAMDKITNILERAEKKFTDNSKYRIKSDARQSLKKDKGNTDLSKITKWMTATEDRLETDRIAIDNEIGLTKNERDNATSGIKDPGEKEIMAEEYNEKLAALDRDRELLNVFGDIDGKNLSEVKAAQDILNEIITGSSAEARAAIAATNKIVNNLAKGAALDTRGAWTKQDMIGTEEKVGKNTKDASLLIRGITKFRALQAAQEYLFKFLDLSAEKGTKYYDWTKSTYYKLSKMWRSGQERLNGARHELKKEFERGLVDIFKTIGNAKKISATKIDVILGYPVKEDYTDKKGEIKSRIKIDENGNPVYKKAKVEISLGQAAHLWMSHQLAENSGYTRKISGINEAVDYTLELKDESGDATTELFDNLDTMLRENHPEMIQYMDWLVDEMLPKALPYITPIYKKLTGHNLLTYANYLFVNAKSTEISADSLTDNSFLTIFQSMVKERKGGKYDLSRNDAILGMYNYIDGVSRFYGLAEPFHIINRVLSSGDVKGAINTKGLNSIKAAIRTLMITHMNGDKDWGRFMQTFLHNYVGSKILLNSFLGIKQQISQLTVLDPKYAPTLKVLAALNLLIDAKDRGVAWDIMKNAYGLKERHMIRIEGSLREAQTSGWEYGKLDKLKDTIESVADQILGADPEYRRRWRNFLYNFLVPTKFGDVVAIKTAGLAIIDANYKQRIEDLQDSGKSDDEIKQAAALHAREAFLHWMNQTQQSSEMTDKRIWQTGMRKLMVPFMNTNMLYTDRIFDAYLDAWRNTQTRRNYLMKKNPGMGAIKATAIALAQKNNLKALQQIILYQFILPTMWNAVTTFGHSIKDLWSDDEEKKRKARRMMILDSTIGGWAKGIPVLAHFYGGLESWWRYDMRQDNAGVLIIFDDVWQTITRGIDYYTIKKDMKGMTRKEISQVNERLEKAYDDTLYSLLNSLGLPGLFIQRIDDVISQDEYDKEVLRGILRIAGVPKTTIKRVLDQEF